MTEEHIIIPGEAHEHTPNGGLPPKPQRLQISVPTRHNPKLQTLLTAISQDEELDAIWYAQNVNAVTRLSMSDHGPVHVQIVANIALRLLRLLTGNGVVPSIVRDHSMMPEDAEVVVVMAALFHDVGMSIHRINHEEYSLIIADRKLPPLLATAYPDTGLRGIMQSEILHAIIAHRSDGHPLTLEAGIVRVADALDITQGRSRIPFEQGSTSIHAISAMAIDQVTLAEGEEKPVLVKISMHESAGIFQIDALLRKKLKGSGLEDFIQIIATIDNDCEDNAIRHLIL